MLSIGPVRRPQQPDQRFQEHRLTRIGRAEQHADLTRGQIEGDVLPNSLGPKRLRQSLNLNTDTHLCNGPHSVAASAIH